MNTKCAKCSEEKPVYAELRWSQDDGNPCGSLCRECYQDMYGGDPNNPKVVEKFIRDHSRLTLTLEVA